METSWLVNLCFCIGLVWQLERTLLTLALLGMHKHFRMLAISEYMRNQGYAPDDAEHTRIPGIWKKLETLYNLSALDERVNDSTPFYLPH